MGVATVRNNLEFHFWAMGALGKGLSGGDRIFIELARRWSKKYPVTIYLWEEGKEMCRRQKLKPGKLLRFKVLKMGRWSQWGFLACYFARIVRSIVEASKLNISDCLSTIVYSSSEFWMDSLPAFILKLRYPQITWVAAWYQTAPSPWQGFWGGRSRLRSLAYWAVQQPIEPLISHWADIVLVNNESERRRFPRLDKLGRTAVVLGAVDTNLVSKYRQKFSKLPKIYAAVFQGRFHPQKGVVELIDIWKKVVRKKPDARLAMIGDGPLMNEVKKKIAASYLTDHVRLFGYVFDGPVKYRIFAQSRVVVHPAFYDSGGMAAAEAMALGLPCVGFDLPAYQSYYPAGMIKVPVGDLDKFARVIVSLLEDESYRQRVGKESLKMINRYWSWDQRANERLATIVRGRA